MFFYNRLNLGVNPVLSKPQVSWTAACGKGLGEMDPTRKTSGCDESAHNRIHFTRMIQRQTCLFFHKSLLYRNFYSEQLDVRIFAAVLYPILPIHKQHIIAHIVSWKQEAWIASIFRNVMPCFHASMLSPEYLLNFFKADFFWGWGGCKKDYSHSYMCDHINTLRTMWHSSNYGCRCAYFLLLRDFFKIH